MKSDRLTREIIRHIMSGMGMFSTPPVGVFDSKLLSDQKLTINEDGKDVVVDIWGGKIISHGIDLHVLSTKIEDDCGTEYSTVIRSHNHPIYALRFHQHEGLESDIFMLREVTGWSPTAVVTRCKALIALETIYSYGLLWEPELPTPELSDALQALILID